MKLISIYYLVCRRKKKKSKFFDSSFFNVDIFLVSFLHCDGELNIFGFGGKKKKKKTFENVHLDFGKH